MMNPPVASDEKHSGEDARITVRAYAMRRLSSSHLATNNFGLAPMLP